MNEPKLELIKAMHKAVAIAALEAGVPCDDAPDGPLAKWIMQHLGGIYGVMVDMERGNKVAEWYKQAFASRTPPKPGQDAAPEMRVTLEETMAKMQELGYTASSSDLRLEWNRIWQRANLAHWCDRLLEQAGEASRWPARRRKRQSSNGKLQGG